MSVKALGYVVVETAQMESWDHFLTQLAGVMRTADAMDGAAQYRIDERPFRFRIQPGTSERLIAAGYELADRPALEALARAISAAGMTVEFADANEAASRGVNEMFRTSDPAGNGLEFFCGDSRDAAPFVSPIGVPCFVTGAMGMGHAVLSAPNFDETVAFYCDVVGFGKSDMPRFYFMGGPPHDPGIGFAFLHADNGRHHSLAIGEGPVPPSGCIHLMLEMPNMIEVGKAHDRMRQFGYPESATLGRHVNDEVTGFYVQTPSGFDLEIGCDGLVIDPDTWVTTRHKEISVWGHVWAWQEAMKKAAE
jgi:3,4-dihydroxy-9,10-secoandrosta-1,3,5(10)-triene-9,17-dione 4,5-dioxygenase